jgi:hypothetical protein
VGSFVDLNSSPNEDELRPDEPVSIVDSLAPSISGATSSRSTHFSARMTEYFILRSGTALDSPPPLLQAQVVGRHAHAHRPVI